MRGGDRVWIGNRKQNRSSTIDAGKLYSHCDVLPRPATITASSSALAPCLRVTPRLILKAGHKCLLGNKHAAGLGGETVGSSEGTAAARRYTGPRSRSPPSGAQEKAAVLPFTPRTVKLFPQMRLQIHMIARCMTICGEDFGGGQLFNHDLPRPETDTTSAPAESKTCFL